MLKKIIIAILVTIIVEALAYVGFHCITVIDIFPKWYEYFVYVLIAIVTPIGIVYDNRK